MPHYPSLYQINTRVRLTQLSRELGRRATFDEIPDHELDWIARTGFDWVWFLGVWQTGPAAREIGRTNPKQIPEYHHTLADLKDEDIVSSPFAIQNYTVNTEFGGRAALARVRSRLQERGVKLLLDFVPNHMAPDHPWVEEHPDFFVGGSEEQLAAQPQNYTRRGGSILAYGRDPYFDGWSDTLQLNYANPALQNAMRQELQTIANHCDGVRCDMAMLILPDVFKRTWGLDAQPFWPGATSAVKQVHPGFVFMAEVYWDLEWTLQQNGFDYTYDKRLYDRLREGHASPVVGHLHADADFQNKSARFLENHDEPRAAATFPDDQHKAAAVITFFVPGLRFFHQGQLDGKRVRIPMQLARGPEEPANYDLRSFYDRLLAALREPVFRNGECQLLNPRAAWEGNPTYEDFVIALWQDTAGRVSLTVSNYSNHQSQCYVPLPASFSGTEWRLADQLSDAQYVRSGKEMADQGLFLDVHPWGVHVFAMERL